MNIIFYCTVVFWFIRAYNCKQNILYMPQKNILDGNLVASFINLSLKEKNDFAKQIGTTVGQVFIFTQTLCIFIVIDLYMCSINHLFLTCAFL